MRTSESVRPSLLRWVGLAVAAALASTAVFAAPAAAAEPGQPSQPAQAPTTVAPAEVPSGEYVKDEIWDAPIYNPKQPGLRVNDPGGGGSGWTGCWSKYWKRSHYHTSGGWLYSYWQTTKICVSTPGRVASVSVTSKGQDASWQMMWSVESAPTIDIKNVRWEGRAVTQHYFKYGVGWPGDISRNHCLQILLNANGHDHRFTTSCDTSYP